MDKNCMAEIANRYACRHFAQKGVDENSLAQVLEAGRLAPSGFGLEPWRFLVIDTFPILKQVADACFSQPPAITAPVLIVIVAHVSALHPDSDYVRQQLTAEAAGADPATVFESYQAFYGNADISSWAVGQCHIAASFMMLEAVHQQLATCPIGGFDEGGLRTAINLPKAETPALVLALGHCADPPGQRRRRVADDVITFL
jgi:nitroreductase